MSTIKGKLQPPGHPRTRIRLTELAPTSGPQAARMLPPALPNLDFPISVNALAENLWMLVKTECIRGRVFANRAEANLALFGLHS
ncbi:hypothetical protein [Streptomyces avermitilis]|uniref:hypothetical protein n=1 Tax=Streptomyces avermitilis TaxID=33903 RepID=UPI0033E02B20